LIEIDGSSYSGSGAVVRQSVAYAALTGQPLHVIRARAARPRPGLAHQHVCAVRALCDLVGGTVEGASVGSRELVFHPGTRLPAGQYRWDVGTAGSVTTLALALLPVLAQTRRGVDVELHGGLFQDFAPSYFHVKHVMLPLLAGMGLLADAQMLRPGYVPRGEGVLRLVVRRGPSSLRPVVFPHAGRVQRVWGISLASHLSQRQVASRMAEAARRELAAAGYREVDIDELDDTTAVQPGAAFALFADRASGARLGADRAGAPRRRAEAIGVSTARQLLQAIQAGATLDRFAADQVVPFAALAAGASRVRIPERTEHIETGAWLAKTFLGAEVHIEDQVLTVAGRPIAAIT
jgi:RNA 3'-terminal phosphate cyclase (ATP)